MDLNAQNPVRIGVAGLTHTHVHEILGRPDKGDVQLVGIVEPNGELADRYLKRHKLKVDLMYASIEQMLFEAKPHIVAAYGSIYDHLKIVEICAPRGIHVMVEKPLAVSLEHAEKMQQLAKAHNIMLITNYETTWYSTNHKAYNLIHTEDYIGPIRKIVVHDGHKGPKEIGVNDEFLEWLTDPVLNGGGAITDFGCYGANLITWLMKGEKPISVTAVTQTIKPEIYPEVDDEATIILTYPQAQGIIQASWNWPFSRKDMEIYGRTGQIFAENRHSINYQGEKDKKPLNQKLSDREEPYTDVFSFIAALINKQIQLKDYDLSSLSNNMIVMEILDAARRSAQEGKTVRIDKK